MPFQPAARDLAVLAPLAAAAVYVGVAAIRIDTVLSTTYWYSDFPEALRLGDAVFHGGWGQGLALPLQTGVGPLWLAGLLHQLTGSDAPSMALGAAIAVLAAGFMVRSATLAVGPRGAVATGVLCIALPPVVGWELLSPIAHSSTLLVSALAAWQLVVVSRGSSRRAQLIALLVGMLAGICLISDPLALAAAALPWMVGSLMLVRRLRSSRSVLLLTAGAAVTGSIVTLVLMHAAGLTIEGGAPAGSQLSIQGLSGGLDTTAVTLGEMLTAAWYSATPALAASLAGSLAFLALLFVAGRRLACSDADGDTRRVYTAFWLTSSLAVIGALCLSGRGLQLSQINYQGHYVDTLWFAAAALLPIAIGRSVWWRRGLAAMTTALALVAAGGVAFVPAATFQGPDYADGGRLMTALDSLHVDRGYGGYWESYGIGWHSGGRLQSLPLQRCSPYGAPRLCRYEFAPTALYQPQGGPVFLVVLGVPCQHDDLCLDAGDLTGLPVPQAEVPVGHLVVYVFRNDVFAALPRVRQS